MLTLISYSLALTVKWTPHRKGSIVHPLANINKLLSIIISIFIAMDGNPHFPFHTDKIYVHLHKQGAPVLALFLLIGPHMTDTFERISEWAIVE